MIKINPFHLIAKMEVHAVTVLLMLSLIQVAQSSQQEFNLTTCSQTRMPCIRKDTTEVPNCEKENITVEMQIVLPILHLTELWFDESKICIVASNGTAINLGKKLKSQQDKERYKLKFHYTQVDKVWGELDIKLHTVTDERLNDNRSLSLELRLKRIKYVTKGKIWIPVQKKNTTLVVPVYQEDINSIKPALSRLQKDNYVSNNVGIFTLVLCCITTWAVIMLTSFKCYSMYMNKDKHQGNYQHCPTARAHFNVESNTITLNPQDHGQQYSKQT